MCTSIARLWVISISVLLLLIFIRTGSTLSCVVCNGTTSTAECHEFAVCPSGSCYTKVFERKTMFLISSSSQRIYGGCATSRYSIPLTSLDHNNDYYQKCTSSCYDDNLCNLELCQQKATTARTTPASVTTPHKRIPPLILITTGGHPPTTMAPPQHTTNSNMCYYKNHAYHEGESWVDGCDYNCTCINGTNGFYQCKDLCPTYINLPAGCNLKLKPGECCSAVDCRSTSTNYSATPPMIPLSPGPTVCKDKLSNCNAYGNSACGQYKGWARDNCADFCGYCYSATPPMIPLSPGPTVCKDKLSNCNAYGNSACGQYKGWARDNCANFCGYCSGGHPPTTMVPSQHTTNSNMCYYKNHAYHEGESWVDGCDYNCTCINGTNGFYSCRDLCPTYTNLPAKCTLKLKPGECCSTVDCPPNPTKSFCYYKGQNYAQGKTWKDGCNYKCTCVDESRGFYQCQTLCLQWNLPAACKLMPAPAGKCCPVPSCPAGYTVNYPPNYVAE